MGAKVYEIIQNPFDVYHCQNLTFNYTAKMLKTDSTKFSIIRDTGIDLESWITFDPVFKINDTKLWFGNNQTDVNYGLYYFRPTNNTLVKTYDISLFATINNNSTYQ